MATFRVFVKRTLDIELRRRLLQIKAAKEALGIQDFGWDDAVKVSIDIKVGGAMCQTDTTNISTPIATKSP